MFKVMVKNIGNIPVCVRNLDMDEFNLSPGMEQEFEVELMDIFGIDPNAPSVIPEGAIE